MHIYANGACHEDNTQKQGVASHGACSFSMEGGEKALEPCKGGALMPTHKVDLGAHAQGGS